MRGKAGIVLAVTLILATHAFAAGTASKTKYKPSVIFTTLYNFTNSSSDGGYAYGQPIEKKGNLIGTACKGGADGYGTVWSLSSNRSITVLHSFDYSDGSCPLVGVTMQSAKGNMFGTSAYGGSAGYGTVWEINSAGTFSTLYNFGSQDSDPAFIDGDVVLDSEGNLYGSGYEGGADGHGAIWELTTSGTEMVLLSCDDNSTSCGSPYLTNLHRDAAGDLFGVSEAGGASNLGTLFEISSRGSVSILHSFGGGSDGSYPTGNVVEYKGNLYGTASGGGYGFGTVWQYDIRSSTFTVLHSFNSSDGDNPLGGVHCEPGKKTVCAGNLFGTTEAGGTNGCGTVWEINSTGTFTTLHSFSKSDGAFPNSRPFVTKAGKVYGTTYYGGTSGYGTVWEITESKGNAHTRQH